MDRVLIALATVVALWVTVHWVVHRTTVFEFERGMRYRRGRFRDVLAPGQYWFVPLWTRIDRVDVRIRATTVPGQEVLTADSVTLKVSLAVRWEIVDPVRAVNRVADVADALYLELQIALRAAIGAATADELLEHRAQLSEQVQRATEPKADELGVRLHVVSVKDVMFPGELKKMFAQVVKARKEGQAALERARGESAALRHLANAARMMDDNPALVHLRTLQSLGEGATVVLGSPAGAMPLPPRRNGARANGDGHADDASE